MMVRILALLGLMMVPHTLAAAERIALVIGMSDYRTVVKLDNTVNDARGIAETLNGIGFQVTIVLDATAEDLRTAIADFAFRSETADLALVYFAGHGVEVQGENFLIPIDADIKSNRDVQRQAISLKELLTAVDRARKMRIVILDSCRDNPFGGALDVAALEETAATNEATRSASGRGLAAPSPDRGTLVAFAARAGERAADGTGAHSPFAQALIDILPKPGLEISLMFRQVRDEVLAETFNQQEPHTYGSLSGTPYYIAGAIEGQSVVQNADLRVAWSDVRPDQEQLLVSLADLGDTRSMLGLAYMRLNPADSRYAPTEAVRLLERAAAAGAPDSQFELARLYEKGLGVAQDNARAMELYLAAADQDFPDALNDLGFLYLQGGLGLTRDPVIGIRYFERAADLRQSEAMYNYAAMIDDAAIPGKGPAEAADYLYQALRSGNAQVYAVLRDKSDTFKPETRKALQQKLTEYAFYDGGIDGSFGPGTQRSIRAAYGLSE